MFASVKTLLSGLIDYAGLFPPASLDLRTAVDNFERYRAGEFAWALGRFIMPASRLVELPAPLPSSVLAGSNLDRDIPSIQAFERRHPGSITAIEVKVASVAEVRSAACQIPSEFRAFFEVPVTTSPAVLVAAIAEEGGCAKVRTGGITADAFLESSDLVRFIEICALAGVPFKATAGLHHPLRCTRALTYEPDSPSAVMHGFLNVFLAAVFIKNNLPRALAAELIEESSPGAFQFDDEGVRWRGHRVTSGEIAGARHDFALGFGSCSFEEPISELRSLGLL